MTAVELVRQPQAPAPVRVSTRNRQIVEGALLADIAVVLLLGRIYLPIPIVRTMWRLLAAAPFVLLAQRQGIRTTLMSGLVAYLLLSALVGPTLALTALDTAFAAILIALAVRWHWPRVITLVVMGLVYAVSDVIIPTIAFAVIFRIPATTLIGAVRTTLHNVVRIGADLLDGVNALLRSQLGRSAAQLPAGHLRSLGYALTAYLAGHWVIVALLAATVLGMANIAAYYGAVELVLMRLPPGCRARQAPA